jgi:hypothetical protein
MHPAALSHYIDDATTGAIAGSYEPVRRNVLFGLEEWPRHN